MDTGPKVDIDFSDYKRFKNLFFLVIIIFNVVHLGAIILFILKAFPGFFSLTDILGILYEGLKNQG